MAVAALHRLSTVLGLAATIVIWAVVLGPFPANDGPMAIYTQFVDQNLGTQPFFGQASAWIRIGLLVLGWSYLGFALASKRLNCSRKCLIVSASVILFLVQAFSSSFHDLANDCLIWIPALTLLNVNERAANLMLRILIALVIAQLFVGVGAYLINYRQFSSPIVGKRASGLLGTPIAVYPLYLMATFLFFSLARTSKRPIGRFVYGTLSVVGIGLVALTFSRGAWLGLAAGIALQAQGKTWKGYVPYFAAAAMFVLAAFAVRSGPLSLPKEADSSMLGHIASIKAGLDLLPSLALTGGGPHSFLHSQVFRDIFEQTGRTPIVPLCLPLNLALDWGVLGMLLFGFIAVQGFFLEKEVSAHPIGFRGSLLALAVAGLFDVPVFRDYLSLPATLLLTGMLALLLPLTKSGKDPQLEVPKEAQTGKNGASFPLNLAEVSR